MSSEGRDVAERRIVRKRADDFVAARERAERQSASQRLRHHDDVGYDPKMFEREQAARSPEPGQDFVENQQGSRPVASIAQRPHKSRRRYAYSSFGLNRLDRNGG